MTPIRKTSEGILVTTGGVRFASVALALAGSLILGALGAARFVIRAADAPSRDEYLTHLVKDSTVHAEQARHSAFQDSAIADIGRKTQATVCFVYRNPKPFCDDQPRRVP